MSLQSYSRNLALVALAAGLLAACAAPSNAPEPSPLPVVKNQVNAAVEWKVSAGDSTMYRFLPARVGDSMVVAGGPDRLGSYKLSTGAREWEVRLPQAIAGGVGAADGVIVVGTIKGVLLAYDAAGKALWEGKATSEIIDPPTVGNGVVLVRTGDGKIAAFSTVDGSLKWQYQRQMPSLILRNYAPIVLDGGIAYAGLPGGRLVSLSSSDGRVLWDSPVALPKGATEVERVADVVSAPVIAGSAVCAVSFQGRVTCFDKLNGSVLWSRDVSSYAGLAVDATHVYVTNEQGHVLAFERETGRSLWTQEKLFARSVSGPAIIAGNVAVADYQGYIHLLNPETGEFMAQVRTDDSRIAAAPQTWSDHLIVQSQNGGVFSVGIK